MSEPSGGAGLSGQFFVARIEYLRRSHGAEGVRRVLEGLAESDQAQLRGVDAKAWYSFGTLVRFDRMVARLLAPGDPTIYDRLGAACSRFRNEWIGPHAALVSPHAFLSRVADEHRRFHDFGRADYRRAGFTSGAIAFSEFPELDEVFCQGMRGFLRASLELLTAGPVASEESECQARGGPACRFELRWTDGAER
jgi:uncharacterized protein (TIGR02265 family)